MSLTARIATTDTGRPAVGRGLLMLVDRYEDNPGSLLSRELALGELATGDRPSSRLTPTALTQPMSGQAGVRIVQPVWVAPVRARRRPGRRPSAHCRRQRTLGHRSLTARPIGVWSLHVRKAAINVGDLDLDAWGRRPVGRGYLEDVHVIARLLDPGHCVGRRRPTPHQSARSDGSAMPWPCRTRGSRRAWLPPVTLRASDGKRSGAEAGRAEAPVSCPPRSPFPVLPSHRNTTSCSR